MSSSSDRLQDATSLAARFAGSHGSLRRAVVGVLAAFALNGMFMGAYGASLPGLRDRLETDSRGLAVLLLAAGLAAITSMQVGGRWADRSGARVPTVAGAPVMAVGLLMLAWAPTLPATVAGAVVFGAGNGIMDVAMNTLAVHVERRRTRPVMSRFHAFFSIGAAVGAGIAAIVGRTPVVGDAVVSVTLVTVAGLGLAGLAGMRPSLPQSPPVVHVADAPRGPLPRATWLLGAMAVCFGLTEGTGFDWSSVHVTDVVNVDPATGALGLVAVSVFMVAIRLVGDHAVERFGRRAVVGAGAATAVVGYGITVVATQLAPVLTGWALVGLGVGMIAPQIYGTAGHLGGGRVMGVVVGFGYSAFLTGPALIGTVADHVGIARAMLVPLATGVAVMVLARWMPRVDDTDGAARSDAPAAAARLCAPED